MKVDVAIVGAGMAGASLAAMLGPDLTVALIEAEDQPGRHATGRSVAFWNETYGGPTVQPLTTASGAWLEAPPAAYGEGFLQPRRAVHLAAPGDEPLLDTLAAEFAGRVALRPLDRAELERRVPGLRPGAQRGLEEASCADIDVARLHAAFLARARRQGVELVGDGEVVEIARAGGGWRLATRRGATIQCDVIVNAAGAWASPIAALAGASPIVVQPFRRTVVQLEVSPAVPPELPLVIDAAGRFYFKPTAAGRLWLSPHDETPAAPGDAAAEELDVAIAIDRLEREVDWTIRRRERAWAGLRSFAPDRAPVFGFDPRAPGFFWFAGQGGFGIQTAPAAAMIGAALLQGVAMPEMVRGIDIALFAPGRFG